MLKKNLWIINQYGSLISNGIGRHRYLSKELTLLGYNVSLISARWSHVTKDEYLSMSAPELEVFEDFKFLRIPVIKYKNAHDKKRILNEFYFAFKLLGIGKKLKEKPDCIIYSSPSLIGYLSAYRLAKKYKAELFFEVRDIWPLTPIQLGGYSHKHPFIRFLQWIEDYAYKKSDKVISVLPNAKEHMVNRGMLSEKFIWIPNGIHSTELENAEPLNKSVENVLPKDKFVIGYTGTFGLANNLNSLIEAAKILKAENEISFVLVGDGKEKSNLVQMSQMLDNVIFIDPIKNIQVQSILKKFDVCFVGAKNLSIYRYGTSPNKLAQYMYAAKPIIHLIIEKNCECGISIKKDDPKLIVEAIMQLKALNSEQRHKIGKIGYDYAIKNLNYTSLSKKLANYL